MSRVETEEQILDALRYGPSYEIAIRSAVGGSRDEVRAALARLVEAGRIERTEAGTFPMYHRAER